MGESIAKMQVYALRGVGRFRTGDRHGLDLRTCPPAKSIVSPEKAARLLTEKKKQNARSLRLEATLEGAALVGPDQDEEHQQQNREVSIHPNWGIRSNARQRLVRRANKMSVSREDGDKKHAKNPGKERAIRMQR